MDPAPPVRLNANARAAPLTGHRRARPSRHVYRYIIIAVFVVLLAATAIILFSRSSPVRPERLIQAGDSKTNCIYVRLGAPLRQAESSTGITYSCIETFSDNEANWSAWVSPWLTEPRYGYTTWLRADPAVRQVIFTIGLIPKSAADDPGWTADCAAGDYNTYARELAVNLVKNGFGYSVIRLGAEMNGTWNAGSLGATVVEWHEWGQCFAQEVQAMRAVPGSHLLFDWNVNANYRDIPLADFYPGNSYVDIIGIDAYDNSGISLPRVGDPARWAALTAEPDGLNAVEAFAAAHGKPLSIPEWGTVVSQGDDAAYVMQMAAFIASHDVAFQSWFDAGDDGVFPLSPAQAPLSLEGYRQAFG